METSTILLYVIGVVTAWLMFYFVVKAAVRNGIKEARADTEVRTFSRSNIPERPVNSSQTRLQQQYDRGEITFEEFQSQWNKLAT